MKADSVREQSRWSLSGRSDMMTEPSLGKPVARSSISHHSATSFGDRYFQLEIDFRRPIYCLHRETGLRHDTSTATNNVIQTDFHLWRKKVRLRTKLRYFRRWHSLHENGPVWTIATNPSRSAYISVSKLLNRAVV